MTCIHAWQIATAKGPTSLGVCILCDEEREFKNATPILARHTAAHRKESSEIIEGRKTWNSQTMGLPFSVEP